MIAVIVVLAVAIGPCSILTCVAVCVGRSFLVQLNTLGEVDVAIIIQSDNSLDLMAGV